MNHCRFYLFCLFLIFFNNVAFANNDKDTQLTQFQIAAEVNGLQITNQNLEKEIISFFGYEFQFLSKEQQLQLKKLYLQKIIDRYLLKTASAKKITEKSSRDRINVYLEQFVFKNIKVTDEECKKEYLENQKNYLIPEELLLREIFIRKSKEDSFLSQGSKSLAEEAHSKAINKDEKFEELVSGYSTHANHISKKETDFITPNQLPDGVSKEGLPKEIGGISPIIETENGFYIFKLVDHKPEKQIPYENVKGEIKEKLIEKRKATAYRTHLNALRRQAKIIVYLN